MYMQHTYHAYITPYILYMIYVHVYLICEYMLCIISCMHHTHTTCYHYHQHTSHTQIKHTHTITIAYVTTSPRGKFFWLPNWDLILKPWPEGKNSREPFVLCPACCCWSFYFFSLAKWVHITGKQMLQAYGSQLKEIPPKASSPSATVTDLGRTAPCQAPKDGDLTPKLLTLLSFKDGEI